MAKTDGQQGKMNQKYAGWLGLNFFAVYTWMIENYQYHIPQPKGKAKRTFIYCVRHFPHWNDLILLTTHGMEQNFSSLCWGLPHEIVLWYRYVPNVSWDIFILNELFIVYLKFKFNGILFVYFFVFARSDNSVSFIPHIKNKLLSSKHIAQLKQIP